MQRLHLSSLATPLLLLAFLVPAACGIGGTGSQSGNGDGTVEPGGMEPQAATGDVPYSLSLEAATLEGYPGLHSFAIVGTADQAVLLAGRTNGLHGFEPSRNAAQFPSFPEEFANDTVYVLDLVNSTLLGKAKVDDLPAPYVQQLKASNTEYLLHEGYLYVVGGYGQQPPSNNGPGGGLITLPFLTAIDYDALVSTVTSGGTLDAAFASAHMANFQHPALAITGGDLQVLGDLFLLAYGHQFDGEYTPGGGQAFQEYSNSVRVFSIQASKADSGAGEEGVKLQVDFKGTDPANTQLDPDNPYHRRDLTIKPAQAPDGSARIGVYGGVFKGGRIEGYEEPIYISADSSASLGISVTVDSASKQVLSQYDCATVQVFSAASSTMYSTFFGGMSYYYWDAGASCLKHDTPDAAAFVDGLPFINSVSTLRVTSGGTQQFLHSNATFAPVGGIPQCEGQNPDGSAIRVEAPYLGSESKFVPVAGVPMSGGVLQLDQITEPTVIGYLVGGIASNSPYGSNPETGVTCASKLVYKVTLDPTTATSSVEPKLCAPTALAASNSNDNTDDTDSTNND